ncbi:MAG: TetR/AcrR family transcriptional regulator [Acidimicrobiales bacterium]
MEPARRVRADAERNRARIVNAARALFAREGLTVSMAAVAREAGVGKATLARHFTSPQELLVAVFADRMDAYIRAAAEALADKDPWRGFEQFIWAVCEMQAQDRGFADVLTLTFPSAENLEERRLAAHDGFVQLIARAKASGHLRSDFESEDLVLLLMANAGVISATANDAPESWRRFVAQVLRSYATPDAPMPPLPPAPSSDDLYRAMARASRSRTDSTAVPRQRRR